MTDKCSYCGAEHSRSACPVAATEREGPYRYVVGQPTLYLKFGDAIAYVDNIDYSVSTMLPLGLIHRFAGHRLSDWGWRYSRDRLITHSLLSFVTGMNASPFLMMEAATQAKATRMRSGAYSVSFLVNGGKSKLEFDLRMVEAEKQSVAELQNAIINPAYNTDGIKSIAAAVGTRIGVPLRSRITSEVTEAIARANEYKKYINAGNV